MDARRFYLTEDDQVVFFDGRRSRCLGHLASVMNGETSVAREAQAWWRAELASDEPIPSAPRTVGMDRRWISILDERERVHAVHVVRSGECGCPC